jgi:hypothetical protein
MFSRESLAGRDGIYANDPVAGNETVSAPQGRD